MPALIRILDDEDLALSDAQGEGYGPVHAAEVLSELRTAEAVEPMLRALARTGFLDILHDRLLCLLPPIGAPVVEPALRAAAEVRGELRESFLAVLAEAGVRDDRVLKLLLEQLRRDPNRAGNLAAYGDARALPDLYRAIDSYQMNPSESPFANQALIEIRGAIEELGGSLTAEQEAKCRRGRESADAFRRSLLAAVGVRPRDGEPVELSTPDAQSFRPGRNDPCWCGSGKKYKRCHLAADEGRRPTGGVTRQPSRA